MSFISNFSVKTLTVQLCKIKNFPKKFHPKWSFVKSVPPVVDGGTQAEEFLDGKLLLLQHGRLDQSAPGVDVIIFKIFSQKNMEKIFCDIDSVYSYFGGQKRS
jgi:hypothetical protein